MINDILPRLPPRPVAGHKGTFGTVLVVAGQATMVGAPCFVASGALRSGCGLVRMALPPALMATCLGLVPSAIGVPRADLPGLVAQLSAESSGAHTVIAAGPGLGVGDDAAREIALVLSAAVPLVLDGTGLVHLALHDPARLERTTALILTPHPGEYAKLAEAWGIPPLSTDPSPEERQLAALQLARVAGAVVVLKGHGTVVSNGVDCWTCPAGNAVLAIPGSGDVLTGVIAGLLAQGMAAIDAAMLGVGLHALAGELWAARWPFGLLAMDLAALIPEAARVHAAGQADQALALSEVVLLPPTPLLLQ